MDQKKYIREKETKFIKDKLKEKKNLLVVGEKGVGKTTIIKQASKQASKKILSIDLMEIQNTKNLFSHLSFKGKNHLFLEKIYKNILKIIGICISLLALIIPITIGYGDWTKWFFLLIPLDIFMLIFIISKTIKHFLKNKTSKIIHFHELNFINDKNKREELLKIIWKIKNIYKNHLLIFEADKKFDQELKYKFNLKEIHLKIIDKWNLIENLFEGLKEETKNQEIKENSLKKLKDLSEENELVIREIMNKLTYRTFENIIEDFKDVYIFSKQEINLLDFLILKFLQLKNSELYYKIMKDEFYNELIISKNEETKKEFLEEIKSILPEVAKYIEHFALPSYILNERKIYNSFFVPEYKSFYFSIFNYDYLEIELIQKFQNQPLIFLQEFNKFNVNKIEIFEFIEDKRIIEFLDFIEKQNSDKLLNFFLNNNDFLKRKVFLDLSIIIINSRKDKKLFFNSLPKKYKYYFFKYYFYNSIDKFDFEEKELKKIEEDLIPFRINDMPKNLFLIGSDYNDKKIFNLQKYYKKIIKDKNKFLTLLFSQFPNWNIDLITKISTDDNFFRLWKFLSFSEKSFVIKCCDEFNKKMPKNKNLKIKKYDSQKKEWVNFPEEELEKYRNYKK